VRRPTCRLDATSGDIEALDALTLTVWWLAVPLPLVVAAAASQSLVGAAWPGALFASFVWLLLSFGCRLRVSWRSAEWEVSRHIAGWQWCFERAKRGWWFALRGQDLVLVTGAREPIQVLSHTFHRVEVETLKTIARGSAT
jgi:hypothetical protein